MCPSFIHVHFTNDRKMQKATEHCDDNNGRETTPPPLPHEGPCASVYAHCPKQPTLPYARMMQHTELPKE